MSGSAGHVFLCSMVFVVLTAALVAGMGWAALAQVRCPEASPPEQ